MRRRKVLCRCWSMSNMVVGIIAPADLIGEKILQLGEPAETAEIAQTFAQISAALHA